MKFSIIYTIILGFLFLWFCQKSVLGDEIDDFQKFEKKYFDNINSFEEQYKVIDNVSVKKKINTKHINNKFGHNINPRRQIQNLPFKEQQKDTEHIKSKKNFIQENIEDVYDMIFAVENYHEQNKPNRKRAVLDNYSDILCHEMTLKEVSFTVKKLKNGKNYNVFYLFRVKDRGRKDGFENPRYLVNSSYHQFNQELINELVRIHIYLNSNPKIEDLDICNYNEFYIYKNLILAIRDNGKKFDVFDMEKKEISMDFIASRNKKVRKCRKNKLNQGVYSKKCCMINGRLKAAAKDFTGLIENELLEDDLKKCLKDGKHLSISQAIQRKIINED